MVMEYQPSPTMTNSSATPTTISMLCLRGTLCAVEARQQVGQPYQGQNWAAQDTGSCFPFELRQHLALAAIGNKERAIAFALHQHCGRMKFEIFRLGREDRRHLSAGDCHRWKRGAKQARHEELAPALFLLRNRNRRARCCRCGVLRSGSRGNQLGGEPW